MKRLSEEPILRSGERSDAIHRQLPDGYGLILSGGSRAGHRPRTKLAHLYRRRDKRGKTRRYARIIDYPSQAYEALLSLYGRLGLDVPPYRYKKEHPLANVWVIHFFGHKPPTDREIRAARAAIPKEG